MWPEDYGPAVPIPRSRCGCEHLGSCERCAPWPAESVRLHILRLGDDMNFFVLHRMDVEKVYTSRRFVMYDGMHFGAASVSTRLDPYSDVEGTSDEWHEVALAIGSGRPRSFKRVAVNQSSRGVALYSPRNNWGTVQLVDMESALFLARGVLRTLREDR